MKKTLFILIISIFYCSYNASADVPKPVDPYDTWTKHNGSILKSIEEGFNFAEQKNVKGISKNDFDNWKRSCNIVKQNYENMNNNNQISKTTDKDIREWNNLNDKIYTSIKNGKWINISIEDAENWRNSCNKFQDTYNSKYNKIKRNNPSPLASDKPNSYKIINQQPIDYKPLINASNEAFKLCIFMPLAVKYDKGSTTEAHKIASDLIKTGHMTHENVKTWGLYQNLLLYYGKYNNEVITFIEKVKTNISQNKDKPLNIVYYKNIFKQENYKYSQYYYRSNKEAASIKYLDDVLNEFFALLDDYVKRNENPSEKFFRNFIINNLDSNYGQK